MVLQTLIIKFNNNNNNSAAGLFSLLQLKFFKKMKNAFYFILKAFFVFKIFKFLSWLLGHLEKTAWLEK